MRGIVLSALITNNIITGETPPSTANANGIVITRGAHATISSNTIRNIKSTVIGNDAVGILLSQAAANTSVVNNSSDNSDLGIYVQDTNEIGTLQNNILTSNLVANMYLVDTIANNSFQLGFNHFNGGDVGLLVQGSGPALLEALLIISKKLLLQTASGLQALTSLLMA